MHADDEALLAGGDYSYLDAEFIRLVRFAFGNAFDFGRMHAVHLAFVVTLLCMDALANLQQSLEPELFLFPRYLPSRHFAFDVTDYSAKIGLEPLLFTFGALHLPGMSIASMFG